MKHIFTKPRLDMALLHGLLRRRLFITLPLAAAFIMLVSALAQPAVTTTTRTGSSASAPHTTVLHTVRPAPDTSGSVLGDTTPAASDSYDAGNTNSSSSDTTVNSDGSTTVTGSSSGSSGDGSISPAPGSSQPAQPAPAPDCTNCPTADQPSGCTSACPTTPPASCGCGAYRRPGTLCPMYACTYQ